MEDFLPEAGRAGSVTNCVRLRRGTLILFGKATGGNLLLALWANSISSGGSGKTPNPMSRLKTAALARSAFEIEVFMLVTSGGLRQSEPGRRLFEVTRVAQRMA